jgi:hypothetical protein
LLEAGEVLKAGASLLGNLVLGLAAAFFGDVAGAGFLIDKRRKTEEAWFVFRLSFLNAKLEP